MINILISDLSRIESLYFENCIMYPRSFLFIILLFFIDKINKNYKNI